MMLMLINGIVIYSLGTMFRARRYSADLLSALEQTVRLNLPLPQMLDRFAAGVRGSMSRKAIAARQALARGDSVAVVLEMMPQFPRRLIPLIEVAERNGRLPQALSRVVGQQRDAARRRARQAPLYRWYPLLIATATTVVVGLVMIFVIPKFESIFRDFRIQLPWVTRLMLSVFHDWGPLIVLFVGAWLLFALISFFGTRRGMGMGLIASPAEKLFNQLPLIGRARQYRALAEALEIAADGIAAERSAVDSIDEAAAITSNAPLRRRLDAWTSAMRSGASITEAARHAQLPPMVWQFLSPTAGGADLAAALQFLAGYYRVRLGRIMALLDAAMPPAVAITMGCVVGWIALSLFAAMVAMINATLPYPVSL
jgi:type IV pilus assembly protein PilC